MAEKEMETITIIIGGLGLIGQKVVTTHIDAGIRVEVWDTREIVNNEKFKTLEDKGKIKFRKIDFTSEKSLLNTIKLTEKDGLRISSVVNLAYPRNKDYGLNVQEVGYKSFTENISKNLGGYFLVLKVFAEKLAKEGGNIVNLSSIYGSMVPRFDIYAGTSMTTPVEYVAIKSGIEALSKYFAKLYIKTKLRINCIAPGGIFDNQDKSFVEKYEEHCGLLGMLSGEEVANSILWFTTKNTAITGQTIIIDDGFSL